jgi:hypothetical protein
MIIICKDGLSISKKKFKFKDLKLLIIGFGNSRMQIGLSQERSQRLLPNHIARREVISIQQQSYL